MTTVMRFFHEYLDSRKLVESALDMNDMPNSNAFYTLLMAAMREADTDNLEILKDGFPEVWQELQARYNAPGGALTDEEYKWILERSR